MKKSKKNIQFTMFGESKSYSFKNALWIICKKNLKKLILINLNSLKN